MSDTTPAQSKHLFLVDAYGYVFRAYHSLPPLTRPDGTPVGAVYGFTNMLFRLKEQITKKHEDAVIVLVYDSGRETFRNQLYDKYKANRPEAPEDLKPQFPILRDVAEVLCLPVVEKVGFEADDIIATYVRKAREKNWPVTIYSADKDLMQLIGDGVGMIDPMKNKVISYKEVEEKFGVPPDRVADVLALIGDTSDNIPGVPSVGPKTAAKLIQQFGDFESVLNRANEVTQVALKAKLIEYADQARLSRKLVALDNHVADIPALESFALTPLDKEKLIPFLALNGFRALLTKMGGAVTDIPAAPAAPKMEAGQAAPSVKVTVIDTPEALVAYLQPARKTGAAGCYFEWQDTKLMQAGFAISQLEACVYRLGEGQAVTVAPSAKAQTSFDLDTPTSSTAHDPAIALFAALTPLFADPSIAWVMVDAKAQANQLARYGALPVVMEDVALMDYLQTGTMEAHNLAGAYRALFGDVMPARDEPTYGATIASALLRLYAALKNGLQEKRLNEVYYTIERPLTPALARMEQQGIKVDRAVLANLSSIFTKN